MDTEAQGGDAAHRPRNDAETPSPPALASLLDIEIGPARAEDIEPVALLSARAFPEYRQLLRCEPAVIAGVLQPLIEARLARVTVARVGAQVAGTMTTSSRGARGDSHSGMSTATRLALARAIRAVGLGRVLLAMFAPLAAGWIAIRRPVRRDELYISSLAVDPAWHGRGIGRRLLEEAEAQAKREGCAALSLYVSIDNERALRIYATAGYREEARARALFRGPLSTPGYIAMRKPLLIREC